MANSPLSPSNLTVTEYSDHFHLSWTNEYGYGNPLSIVRKTGDGPYGAIGSVWYPTSEYDDYDVEQCTAYSYYVTTSGYDEFGNPYGPTNYELSKTLIIPAPTGVAAEPVIGSPSADIEWTNNTPEYDTIRIQWRLGNTGAWSGTTASFTASARLGPLGEGYLYGFRVRGEDPVGGYGTYSDVGTATIDVVPPSNLVAIGDAVDDTEIDLNWDLGGTGQNGYDIFMSEGTGATAYTAAATAGSGDTAGSVGGLTPTVRYAFKVRAKRGDTAGSWSGTASVIAGAPPDAPSLVVLAASGPYAMDLSWTPTGSGYDGFLIYRKLDGDVYYDEIDTLAPTATTYHDDGLDSVTKYWYFVSSYNDSGESDGTAASASTDNDTEAPTGLALTVLSDSRIRLKFSNNSDDVDSHKVMYRKSTEAYGSTDQTSLAGSATGGVQGNLEGGTKYYFKVRDLYEAEYSAYCGETGATTLSPGTISSRRNETYFAFTNELCLTTDVPQGVRGMDRVWTSKPTDFSDQDPEAVDRYKTVERVVLEYEDTYQDTPVIISLSTDGGITWVDAVAQGTASTASARYVSATIQDGTGPAETAYFFNIGSGSGAAKSADYLFVPKGSKYFQVRVRSYDSDTAFVWTGLYLYYKLRGPYFET